MEMSKNIAPQDGFTAYKNIWKKNVMKSQEEVHEE